MAMLEAAVAGRRTGGHPHVQAPDFERLLDHEAWAGLPADVRRRFARHASQVVYPGQLEVRASWFGWLIAQVLRLAGTPLAPWRGPDVPTDVTVWQDSQGALVWDRAYRFKGRQTLTVSSRKLVGDDGALLEITRGGLGMSLSVEAEPGGLVFRSREYFLQLGPLRLPIPMLITPGPVVVRHTDLGAGDFRFEMTFRHPWFGDTLHQAGVFTDPFNAVS